MIDRGWKCLLLWVAWATPTSGQEMAVLSPGRPVLLKLQCSLGGRPLDAQWAVWAGRVFARLDVDGDKRLDRNEARRLAHPRWIEMQVSGDFLNLTGAAVDFADLDTAPKDGWVSGEELASYLLSSELAVPKVRSAEAPAPLAERIADLLLAHLGSAEGELSATSWKGAAAALRHFDANDDERVAAAELVRDAGALLVRAPADGVSLLRIATDVPAARFVDELTDRYDDDRDGLSRADLGLVAVDGLDSNEPAPSGAGVNDFLRWLGPSTWTVARVELSAAPAISIESAGEGARLAHAMPDALIETVDSTVQLSLVEMASNAADDFAAGRASLAHRFESADLDHDLALGDQERKAAAEAAYWEALFQVAGAQRGDRADADNPADPTGQLGWPELDNYLDLLAAAVENQVLISIVDEGPALFHALDEDADAKLGPRELRQGWRRIQTWDRDGDDRVGRHEIPRRYRMTIGRPAAADTEPMAEFPPAAPTAPTWFLRMDRNGDGDLSPREFLGKSEDFERLDADGDGLIDPNEAGR